MVESCLSRVDSNWNCENDDECQGILNKASKALLSRQSSEYAPRDVHLVCVDCILAVAYEENTIRLECYIDSQVMAFIYGRRYYSIAPDLRMEMSRFHPNKMT